MKILFQEPFIDKGNIFGKFGKSAGNNTFPYGVACIAKYVRERGHEVSYLEPNIEQMGIEEYKKYILDNKFDAVGIGSTTLQIGKTLRTFEKIKKINPKIITVLGGIHGTIMPRETLESSDYVDYIVLGEGEKSFNRLLECLESKTLENIRQIRGIAFKQQGKIVLNPPAHKDFLTPREFPFPAYDLFPMKKYISQPTYSKKFPSYSILCSRGCAYNCAFCNDAVFGKTVRYKEVDSVIEEIIYLKKKYKAKGLIFQDSTFTVNNKWVEEFCKKMIQRNVNLPWACSSRVDTANGKILRLMKKAGCWEILYGIESANQKSLDLVKKGTTVEQNTKILKLTMKLGIIAYASYILCLPGETKEDALNTIRYAKRMATPIALFYLPVVYPKTVFWDICKQQGILRENAAWEDYGAWDQTNSVYINPLIGKEEMQKILNYAYMSYYLTPKVILRNLKEILLLRQDIRRHIRAVNILRSLLE